MGNIGFGWEQLTTPDIVNFLTWLATVATVLGTFAALAGLRDSRRALAAIASLAVGFSLFARFRGRVAYWV